MKFTLTALTNLPRETEVCFASCNCDWLKRAIYLANYIRNLALQQTFTLEVLENLQTNQSHEYFNYLSLSLSVFTCVYLYVYLSSSLFSSIYFAN